MILTVLDTETTGLEPHRHEIIDIALIQYVLSEDGQRFVVNKFNSKIKPAHIETANPVALKINHYKEEEYVTAPAHRDVLPVIRKYIENSDLLIGQNLIFDLNFINEACQKLYGEEDKVAFPPYIDTKAMADVLRKKSVIKKSGMDYLCEHFNVEFEGNAHTALVDCERTMMVFDRLLEECKDYELYSYESPYDPRYDS